MDGEEVILIAVNQQDIASTNQADALRNMDAWKQRASVENNPAYELKHLRMLYLCLLYTSPSPRDLSTSRMPSSA